MSFLTIKVAQIDNELFPDKAFKNHLFLMPGKAIIMLMH